ncbi:MULTISPECIES: ATP-dependent helicase [unclassified Bradyrhizobium]|uniref:ATP-dependent helicase n=1 Tax=unclassified Bradyrhizobium TaxID=2631580 RepID=UPI00291674E0|nr:MULTISPECIES: ATP-dependent helicase [unclassified Bradyrhizobium]
MPWDDGLQLGTSAYAIAASVHPRIRVLAGPGAGKSFAMKRRVARILEVENATPGRVLAVTFTRVAAEDLHRELSSLGVPGAAGLNGRTLHSLAMNILMRQHVLAALGRVPRPLNEFELEPLLADLSDIHGSKHERRRLMRAYGAAWARLQTQQPGYAPSAAEQAFANELVGWLVLHQAMLIDEIIPHLFQYLHGNPGAPERAEYTHVLIDEFQDLNRAEQDVLRYLGQNAFVCIVGDDDQSIYSFKHAHPDGIRQWHTLHATDDHAISECRRCPVTVVRMANALISRNPDRTPGRAMTERAANGIGEVVIRQYTTADAESQAVAGKITQLIQQGVHPREIIVLAQRATFATPVFERLRAAGIPTKSYYAETELETIEAQERFALLKLMLNNEDRVALRWLLGRSHNSWHAKQYGRLLNHVRHTGASPWSALSSMAAGLVTIPHTSQLVQRFVEIQNDIAALALAPDLDQFIQLWLPANPATQLLSEAAIRARLDASTITELYDSLYNSITQPEVPMEVSEVRVMSLHKSKGLSSPFVFIVGCVEGLLPARPDSGLTVPEQLAKLQEDRRLFYVGITRVKADPPNRAGYLALTYAQTMSAASAFKSQITPVAVAGGLAHLQASRFIGEMAPHAPQALFNAPL